MGLKKESEYKQGDIQTSTIRHYLDSKLMPLTRNCDQVTLIDYGCGIGRFLDELKFLVEDYRKKLNYIGVNYLDIEDIRNNILKKDLDKYFSTVDIIRVCDFERQIDTYRADGIIAINVLHEISLLQLPRRLFYLVRVLKTGRHLFLHDMQILPKGEPNFITWEGLKAASILESCDMKTDNSPKPDESPSGVPLFTVIAERRNEKRPSLNTIAESCLRVYEKKRDKVILYLHDCLERTMRRGREAINFLSASLCYNTVNLKNIDNQLKQAGFEPSNKDNELRGPMLFVGCTEPICEIHNQFLSDVKNVIVVKGKAGSGKTQLMYWFADELRSSGKYRVLWIRCHKDLRIDSFLLHLRAQADESGYKSLANFLEENMPMPGQLTSAEIIGQLNEEEGYVLFFDDYHLVDESLHSFVKGLALIEKPKPPRIILSSRPTKEGEKYISSFPKHDIINVTEWSKEHTEIYLESMGVNPEMYKGISSITHNHPLATRLAASIVIVEKELPQISAPDGPTAASRLLEHIKLKPAEEKLALYFSVFEASVPQEAVESFQIEKSEETLSSLLGKEIISQTANGEIFMHPTVKDYFHKRLSSDPGEEIDAHKRAGDYYWSKKPRTRESILDEKTLDFLLLGYYQYRRAGYNKEAISVLEYVLDSMIMKGYYIYCEELMSDHEAETPWLKLFAGELLYHEARREDKVEGKRNCYNKAMQITKEGLIQLCQENNILVEGLAQLEDLAQRIIEETGLSQEKKALAARLIHNIGTYYIQLGSLEAPNNYDEEMLHKAIEMNKLSLSISERCNYPKGKADSHHAFGFVHNLLGQKEQAIQDYEEALDAAFDRRNMPRRHHEIGKIHLELAKAGEEVSHHSEEAQKHLEAAREGQEKIGYRRGYGETLTILADYLAFKVKKGEASIDNKKEKKKEASKLLEEASKIAQELGDNKLKKEIEDVGKEYGLDNEEVTP
ncbi:NACHT domain-containing protein [bacterium]|nr:NACHT domain-containing protein [bacterium]